MSNACASVSGGAIRAWLRVRVRARACVRVACVARCVRPGAAMRVREV
jgi:hypothetical protein